MKEEIFRKKSIDRVNSPESLNDYVRVTNPGVWLILTAVAVLLIGACVWGIFGHLDTYCDVECTFSGSEAVCLISSDEVKEGMKVEISDTYGTVSSVRKNADGKYEAKITADVPDGKYEAKIITESISPISFIVN